MIENREQLISMSTEWVNMAKNDLRDKVITFIEETGVSHQELANMLAVSNGEIEQIVNGNGDITLSTFAKLLIATNNVIEIKPISETPFGDYENMLNPSDIEEFEKIRRGVPMGRMPMGGMPMGRMPMGGVPSDGMPMEQKPTSNRKPRFHSINERTFTHEPMEDKQSRNCCSRRNVTDCMFKENNKHNGHLHNQQNKCVAKKVKINLDELDKRGLANIVLANHWNNEIDINSSSRSELIDFLEFKDNLMENMPKQEHECNEYYANCKCEKKESDNVERIKEFLYNQAMANPQLREIVEKYMDK